MNERSNYEKKQIAYGTSCDSKYICIYIFLHPTYWGLPGWIDLLLLFILCLYSTFPRLSCLSVLFLWWCSRPTSTHTTTERWATPISFFFFIYRVFLFSVDATIFMYSISRAAFIHWLLPFNSFISLTFSKRQTDFFSRSPPIHEYDRMEWKTTTA